MYAQIPELITLCGADANAQLASICEMEDRIIGPLNLAKSEAGACIMINDALATAFPDVAISETMRAAAVTQFKAGVMEAAKQSSARYDKHVKPSLVYYELRQRFDVRYAPPVLELDSDVANLRGCLFFTGADVSSNFDYGLRLESQYRNYCKEYHSPNVINGAGEHLIRKHGNYNYWRSKATCWPELMKVALWWNAYYTSSIAAERVFGVARLVDGTQRGNMHWDTFARELKMRVNKQIVFNLFEVNYKDFKSKYPTFV
jgi:hypothetical protein